MLLQDKINFQASTFNNKIEFTKAVRMLNTQEFFTPTHIAKDLIRWESNYGLSVGYNKTNNMLLIKNHNLELLFTATGEVGKHIFEKCISHKVRCK